MYYSFFLAPFDFAADFVVLAPDADLDVLDVLACLESLDAALPDLRLALVGVCSVIIFMHSSRVNASAFVPLGRLVVIALIKRYTSNVHLAPEVQVPLRKF